MAKILHFMQGMWVRTLVGALKSHVLWGMDKKLKKKKRVGVLGAHLCGCSTKHRPWLQTAQGTFWLNE